MKYLIALSPGAKTDINSAARWYLKVDLNLALRFFVEIDTTLQRIARMPYAFPVHRAPFRRRRLKRFPYWIYYFVGKNVVNVEAIFHERRSEPGWITRGSPRH